MEDWKTVLQKLRVAPESVPWRERRTAAREAGETIAKDDGEIEELFRICAKDPKWEVRKTVAEQAQFVTEPLFMAIVKMLGGETNHYVVEALSEAGIRRKAVQTNGIHRGMKFRLMEIEKKLGSLSANAAMKFADQYVAEHLKEISHNLKSLLMSLKRSAKELDKGVKDERMKTHATRVLANVEHLSRLSKDINTYSSEPKLECKTLSIPSLIEEAHRLAREGVCAQRKDCSGVVFKLEATESWEAPASRTHLVVVFTNLIQNAIEAHEKSGELLLQGQVTVRTFPHEGRLRVEVADAGMGISAEDLSSMLDFIPGQTSKTWGTGYGLPIANRYVEAHGGTLRIASKRGEGTTVTVDLPRRMDE